KHVSQEDTALLSSEVSHYDTVPSSAASTLVADEARAFAENRPENVFTAQVILYIVSFGILSYHANAYEHLFPILLQSPQTNNPFRWFTFINGLGFSSQLVGLLYTSQGVFAIFTQLVIFPSLTSYFSVYKLYMSF